MKSYKTRTPTSHPPELVYHLVSDVESYPAFVPFCKNLTINKREQVGNLTYLDATMDVAFGLLKESFRSQVTLNPDALVIDVNYLSGPFSHLHNHWRFIADDEHTTIIDFSIEYAFSSRLLSTVATKAIDGVFKKMTRVFLSRADELAQAKQTPSIS